MTGQPSAVRVPADVPFRVRAALASMAATWVVGGDSGGVSVVAGGDWLTAIGEAIAARTDVVLVVEVPRRLAPDDRIPVIVELGWDHDPAAVAAAPEFARLLDADALVEITVTAPTGTAPDRALLGQLALLRTVTGPVSGLRVIRADRTGYDLLAALASGARVAFAALFSDALHEEATVRLVTTKATVELKLTAPATASPGIVRVVDDSGSRVLPTGWETSARSALRAALTGGHDGALAALVSDVAQVTSLDLGVDRAD